MATFDQVLEIVSRYRGVAPETLLGHTRRRPFIFYRFDLIHMLREHTSLSLVSIGELVGRRDHTTIQNALKRTRERLSRDPILRSEFSDMHRMIHGEMRRDLGIPKGALPHEIAHTIITKKLPARQITTEELWAMANWILGAAQKHEGEPS